MDKLRYTETFFSFQGEGHHTGKATVWLRLFGCSLECNGFGQKNPRDADTWDLPYLDHDPIEVKTLDDLPVWSTGCDSSYSWSKRWRHLALYDTVDIVAKKLEDLLPRDRYEEPYGNDIHLCITGGEPLLQQRGIVALVERMITVGNYPENITIETNGTRSLTPVMVAAMDRWHEHGISVFFSVSPKLRSVAGEMPLKAIKPECVESYTLHGEGQLKFVLNRSPFAWDELEDAVQQFRDAGVDYPIWIMPCGGTLEEQNQDDTYLSDLSDLALSKGYHVSHRVHVFVYGNEIGR